MKVAEHAGNPPSTFQSLFNHILNEIGEDPHREGLIRTPARFEKALSELTAGYKMSATDVVGEGVFQSEGAGLVCVRDIDFFSLCEHHMLPFWGQVSISYLPGKDILGLSKLARITEVYSRRLQVQERLTKEIAEAVQSLINPEAIFVKCQAQHMCMMMRGVRSVSALTKTEFGINLDKISEQQRDRLISMGD